MSEPPSPPLTPRDKLEIAVFLGCGVGVMFACCKWAEYMGRDRQKRDGPAGGGLSK